MAPLRLPVLVGLLAAAAACSPATRRPAFAPLPEARRGELELEVPVATDSLARALIAAGIPVSRIAARDGYLETPWFDTATGRAAAGRPLGPGRVRVRGWVSPSRHGYSELVVETVFRPFADPSAAPRDLERSVAYAHPVRQRVRSALSSLGARSSVEEPDAITLAQRRARADSVRKQAQRKTYAKADPAIREDPAAGNPAEAAGDSARAGGDTVRAAGDTVRVARDTSVRRDSTLALADSARRAPAARVPAPTIIAPPPSAAAPVYSVQVAASTDRAVVDLAAGRLRELGFTPRIVTESGMMKVRTGRYATESAARAAQRRLRTTFPDAFMVRR
jgi:hypothetical protein